MMDEPVQYIVVIILTCSAAVRAGHTSKPVHNGTMSSSMSRNGRVTSNERQPPLPVKSLFLSRYKDKPLQVNLYDFCLIAGKTGAFT